MTRYRSYDWEHEIDPVMSIECLDPTGTQEAPDPRGYSGADRPHGTDAGPVDQAVLCYAEPVKANVGVNVFEPVRYGGALRGRSICRRCSTSRTTRP